VGVWVSGWVGGWVGVRVHMCMRVCVRARTCMCAKNVDSNMPEGTAQAENSAFSKIIRLFLVKS